MQMRDVLETNEGKIGPPGDVELCWRFSGPGQAWDKRESSARRGFGRDSRQATLLEPNVCWIRSELGVMRGGVRAYNITRYSSAVSPNELKYRATDCF